VMERALGVALRLDPPPPVPQGASARLKTVDAALQSGKAADLEAARNLLQISVIEVPWWGDGWKRLADVDERLGALPSARGALRYCLKATRSSPDRDIIEQRIASLGQRIGGGGSSVLAAAAGINGPSAPAVTTDLSGNWSTTDGRIIAVKQTGSQVIWTSCC